MQQLIYTIPQALNMAPMGRTTMYEQFKTGALKPIHIGRRTYVSHEELTRFIESLDTAGGEPGGSDE